MWHFRSQLKPNISAGSLRKRFERRAFPHALVGIPRIIEPLALPELRGAKTASIRHVLQFQLLKSEEHDGEPLLTVQTTWHWGVDLLLAFGMEIDTADLPLELVKGNVVESLETGPRYGAHSVVGYKEMLLPAHEDGILLADVRNGHGALPGQLLEGTERAEPGPVAQINPRVGAPVVVLGKEAVLGADYLALEVCRQCGMVLGEACRKEVSIMLLAIRMPWGWH